MGTFQFLFLVFLGLAVLSVMTVLISVIVWHTMKKEQRAAVKNSPLVQAIVSVGWVFKKMTIAGRNLTIVLGMVLSLSILFVIGVVFAQMELMAGLIILVPGILFWASSFLAPDWVRRARIVLLAAGFIAAAMYLVSIISDDRVMRMAQQGFTFQILQTGAIVSAFWTYRHHMSLSKVDKNESFAGIVLLAAGSNLAAMPFISEEISFFAGLAIGTTGFLTLLLFVFSRETVAVAGADGSSQETTEQPGNLPFDEDQNANQPGSHVPDDGVSDDEFE